MSDAASLLEGPFSIERPFWEALARGELRLPQCEGCAAWNWPPVPRCPGCGSFEHEWPVVEPTGVVYSWTTIHRASKPQFVEHVPYSVVLAELPQAGNIRLMGRLDGPADDLAIGAPLLGAFRPPSELSSNMPTIVWALAGGAAR